MTQYEAITPDILDELKAISGHRVIVGEEINPDYTHCLLYTSPSPRD